LSWPVSFSLPIGFKFDILFVIYFLVI